MTMHPTPAERLLAMLEDEQAFESLPAEEIRADLDAVGLDPTRCVAFAKALAVGTESPGGQLLGAIDKAEDAEDEIARLESADIETVRAQFPEGTAAAVAAEARRQAGEESAVVAMKPRRRRILRWGGPVAGIAASVLLLVVVGAQLLESQLQEVFDTTSSYLAAANGGKPAAEYGKDEAAAPVARYAMPEAEEKPEAEKKKFAPEQDSEAPADSLAKLESGPVEAPAFSPAPPAPASGLLGRSNEGVAVQESRSREQPRQQGAGALMTESVAEPEAFAAKPQPAEEAFDDKADGDTAADRLRKAVAPSIAAMAVVDPSQVPLAVQSQALPDAGLLGRVDEARRLAAGRPVIALYRVATGAARQDFAQVPLQGGYAQQLAAPGPLTELLGPDAANYDFIALPEQ